MRLYSFAPDAGHLVDRFGSDFILSPLTDPDGQARVACFHLAAGGSIGEHEAVVGQLFCVVSGEGWVSGADGSRRAIGPLEAAYWEPGETHATGTEGGLMAVVLEGDGFAVGARELLDTSVPAFVPGDFDVPDGVVFGELRLEPLGPEHNVADHAAWTSSLDHIKATPGFADRSWPVPMTVEENLRDLQEHRDDFRTRQGFTYTVLDPQGTVVGCVYIYPSSQSGVDAEVRSWVSAERAELDRPLWKGVSAWLQNAWPFTHVRYAERDPETDTGKS